MKHYQAPWSKLLILISLLATVLCLAVAVFVARLGGRAPTWVAVLPLVIVIGSALFTIRGYTVTPDAIMVQRLLWTTRLPLAGLQSARYEPEAMRRSVRLFGNGGLFSFTGFYYNKLLGTYRAFVTDPRRAVVLRYPKRTFVLTPSAPEDFIHSLSVPGHAA